MTVGLREGVLVNADTLNVVSVRDVVGVGVTAADLLRDSLLETDGVGVHEGET